MGARDSQSISSFFRSLGGQFSESMFAQTSETSLVSNNTNRARRTRFSKTMQEYSSGTCGLFYSLLEGLLIVLFLLLPRYPDNLLQSAATHRNTIHQRLVLWLTV